MGDKLHRSHRYRVLSDSSVIVGANQTQGVARRTQSWSGSHVRTSARRPRDVSSNRGPRDGNNNVKSESSYRDNWKKVSRFLTVLQHWSDVIYELNTNFMGISSMALNADLPDVVQDINYIVHPPLRNPRLNDRAQRNAVEVGQQLNQVARGFDMERGQNRAVPFNQLAHDILNELIQVLGTIFFGLLRP